MKNERTDDNMVREWDGKQGGLASIETGEDVIMPSKRSIEHLREFASLRTLP